MAGAFAEFARCFDRHGFDGVAAPIEPATRVGAVVGVAGLAHADVDRGGGAGDECRRGRRRVIGEGRGQAERQGKQKCFHGMGEMWALNVQLFRESANMP